uniref:Uncharacterized protein n=1 Tax=Aegilops tauschii subsp. strangulata TaxID=200361 RepID=A0A453N4H1_AEGTS
TVTGSILTGVLFQCAAHGLKGIHRAIAGGGRHRQGRADKPVRVPQAPTNREHEQPAEPVRSSESPGSVTIG